jgi:hypothetical protein
MVRVLDILLKLAVTVAVSVSVAVVDALMELAIAAPDVALQ